MLGIPRSVGTKVALPVMTAWPAAHIGLNVLCRAFCCEFSPIVDSSLVLFVAISSLPLTLFFQNSILS